MKEKTPVNPKAKRKKLIIFAVLAVVYLVILIWGYIMETVKYSVSSDKIDTPLRVVFISDLHNCFFGGTDQSALMEEIDKHSPDLVLFGGDVLDFAGGTKFSLEIMKQASEKYPCCYSPGNHEMLHDGYYEFRKDVQNMGVNVLEGGFVSFEINSQTINVFGATDDTESVPNYNNTFITQLDSCIELSEEAEGYNIFLAHQPEIIDSYLDGNFDLILSGHAHGGQWRIPYILDQGLYAPDQGIRPDYTNGIYYYSDTTHIISKGLAKPLRMIFIPRIFNRPEFTVIDVE